jgi:ribonuclease HI
VKNNLKRKWYVVWHGFEPGVYETWDECKKQVDKFNNSSYKSFFSHQEAKKAYELGPQFYTDIKSVVGEMLEIDSNSLSVDAACSGNPGRIEYRGIYMKTKEEIFHVGPFQDGTNNIGEFLAIVHGLTWIKQKSFLIPIYSDSKVAISWVQNRKCKTKLKQSDKNICIFNLIYKAEKWLRNNSCYIDLVFKWDTKKWGEISADFSRK